MAIPASAQVEALGVPSLRVAFVNQDTGVLNTHGQQILGDAINFINGMSRAIPCNASGTNIITLTMLDTSPLILQYNDFDSFRFIAANTTTGLVTANVVTPQGALATLNVYKTNGSAQATTGDIVLDRFYELIYVDALNSGAGGFVLR